MRKSAAEYLKRLEMRVARLERQAKYVQWDGMLWDEDARVELKQNDPARYEQMVRDLRDEGNSPFGIYRKELVDRAHNLFRRRYTFPQTKIGKILAAELAKEGAELRENLNNAGNVTLVVSALPPEQWDDLSADMEEKYEMGYSQDFSITKSPKIKQQLTRVNQIIRKVLRKFKVDFDLNTVTAEKGFDGWSVYKNQNGVTHKIYLNNLADLQERGLLGSKRMRLDIKDIETHNRKERLRNRRRAHSKSAGFRVDSGIKRRLQKELKSYNSLAGKITNISYVTSNEYGNGVSAFLVRIDYDDPMIGSDEMYAIITGDNRGRDQNFYELYEDRSEAEDHHFFN